MSKKNAFYAQSGGVTAVINATACGVIETARKHRKHIANVYAGRNGIIGALTEDMIDTNRETAATIAALKYTPGGAFGSARYKLKSLEENRREYERLIEVFAIDTTSSAASCVETATYFATEPNPGQLSVTGRSLSTVFGMPRQVMGKPIFFDSCVTLWAVSIE